MSATDHDSQRRDSMMPQLQEIFAPPTVESLSKKYLAGIPLARKSRKRSISGSNNIPVQSSTNNGFKGDDPSWRKPRPNCHDYCDACNCSEGDRLVCDRCPASFHLECLDPPLEPHKAPTGIWYCHRCTVLLKVEEEGSRSSSGNQSCSTSSSATAAASADLVGWLATGWRTAPSKSSPLSIFWDVFNYARFLNPKEFELPKDLLPAIKIPGSYKTLSERKANPIIELENGQIPKPVRRCYFCVRTCFHAPLLPCDYCTACFHLECLDPPMAQFPPRSDRWMCPLHAEHTVDKCLVQSIRLSERIRAWNQLAVFKPNISQKSVAKITDDVLDGASHDVRYGSEDERAVLSTFLQNVHRRRLEAFAVREVLGSLNSNSSVRLNKHLVKPIAVPNAVKALYANPVQRLPRIEENPSLTLEENEGKYLKASKEDANLFIRGLLEFYLQQQAATATSMNSFSAGLVESHSLPAFSTSTETKFHSSNTVDHKVAPLIAKINDILREFENVIPNRGIDSKSTEIFDREDLSHNSKSKSPLPHHKLKNFTVSQPDFVTPSAGRLFCRAVLIPCADTIGPSVPMSYRQLSIGSGPDCHLCLANYQIRNRLGCSNISPLHATVFYDEWSRHFELLNYSEFGSFVDAIPFKNDAIEKEVYQCKPSTIVKHVRHLIETDGGASRSPAKCPILAARNRPVRNHCCVCQVDDTSDAGWEGSAILHHGSVLQFGCYSFTFSLVDWLRPLSREEDVSSVPTNTQTNKSVSLPVESVIQTHE